MAHVAPGNGGEVATAAHGRGRTLRAARLCRLRRCGVGLRWPSGAELLRLAAAFAGELLEARPYVVADQRAGRLLQLLGHHRRRCRQALGRQGIEEVAPPQAGLGTRQAARSEERRVGKEYVRTGRVRWWRSP